MKLLDSVGNFFENIFGFFGDVASGLAEIVNQVKTFITDFFNISKVLLEFIPEPYNEIIMVGLYATLAIIVIKLLGKVRGK